MIKAYYLLTKPGIIYGNDLPAIGAFFLAAHGHVTILLFICTIIGLSFVIASACVFNNFIDRDIDSKMARTKSRALVKKVIPESSALLFGSTLGLLGIIILLVFTNLLAAFLAFLGFIFYVLVYTFMKRRSELSTLIGSIPGAIPPVVGYCAVTNHIDAASVLLFLILVCWQMPHFYAIAIFRTDDYTKAQIPVLPAKKGLRHTKIQMNIFILAFIVATSLLTIFHYTGYIFLGIMLLIGLIWLGLGIQGFHTGDVTKWARKMFFLSLIIILAISLLLASSSFLP